MDYADPQSSLRSVSTSITRNTGMERGGAINLVFDDSVSISYKPIDCFKIIIDLLFRYKNIKPSSFWIIYFVVHL